MRRIHLIGVPVAAVFVGSIMGGGVVQDAPFTNSFGLEHVDALVPDGGNAYFSLDPGRVLRYRGVNEHGEVVEVEMTTLTKVRPVLFEVNGRHKLAVTRVIEEREWIDGALDEVTQNYYARCAVSGNIYYFGEDVALYENGELVSAEGTWLAGRDGAEPGLIMPQFFLLGSRYCQENAPGVAMDRAENTAMSLAVTVPAGAFRDCVSIVETSELEPDEVTLKVYAPGVGPIVDSFLQLVDFSIDGFNGPSVR